MRKLVIEKAAVRNNMSVLKDRAQGAALYGVLTGNGSGLGAVCLARLLRDNGVGRFAVGTVEEARQLRENGFEDEEILMLRSTVDREELEQLVDLNVVCTVSSVDTGLALNAVAENRSTVAEAHIQVDTGLGFGGFLAGEPEKILLAYRSLPNVALSGIYTQLHAVSLKDNEVGRQLDQFGQILDAIHQAGFETGMVHAAGSFALMHFDAARLDAVRAGSAILGRCRRTNGDGLKTVGYGQAPITEVRWLPKGHTVGAGKLVTLKRPTPSSSGGTPAWRCCPWATRTALGWSGPGRRGSSPCGASGGGRKTAPCASGTRRPASSAPSAPTRPFSTSPTCAAPPGTWPPLTWTPSLPGAWSWN